MISYRSIEDAFFYVSSDQQYMNSAFLNKKTGETYYASDLTGEDDIPADVDENDDYIEIPHKNDLDLGRNLVFDFVSQYIPEKLDEVYLYFGRQGAYSRYKFLLEKLNLLQKWYDFEEEKTRSTLMEWCRENDLDVQKE